MNSRVIGPLTRWMMTRDDEFLVKAGRAFEAVTGQESKQLGFPLSGAPTEKIEDEEEAREWAEVVYLLALR